MQSSYPERQGGQLMQQLGLGYSESWLWMLVSSYCTHIEPAKGAPGGRKVTSSHTWTHEWMPCWWVDVTEEAGIHVHNSGNVLETKAVAYPFVPHVHLQSTWVMETIELYCIYLFDFFKLFILYWNVADWQCYHSFRWTQQRDSAIRVHASILPRTPLLSQAAA